MAFVRDGSMISRAGTALALAACCALAPLRAEAGIVALSGHVTSHLTGEPLADVRVSIEVATGFGPPFEIGYAYTDIDGAYDWTGDCESLFTVCDVVVVDPPYLSGGGAFDQDAVVAVVDVALLTPSTLSGTLRFPGVSVTGMEIEADRFIPEAGSWGSAGFTAVGADGSFVLGSLSPDTYRVCTVADQRGDVRQCFDHVNVPPLAVDPDATLVDVAEGTAIDGIDFDLVEGGTLSGTIYDGYLGIALANSSAQVQAFDANGTLLSVAGVEASGAFHLRGLPDGTFYLGINVGEIFSDGVQFYPGIVCTFDSCPPPTNGTPLTIAGANEITGLDFTVHPAVVVRGRVVDAVTGEGIGGVDVGTYYSDGVTLATSAADTGAYIFYWYADSTFEVGAFDAPPRVNAVYPGASCIGNYCVGDATPLSEPSGTVLSDIDLPMQLGAVMSGQLLRSDNGAIGGTAEIMLFDDAYHEIWVAPALDGYYSTDAWLPGTYYVEALGYVQLTGCAFYLDRPCPDSGNPADVDPTPVTVAAGETRTGIDFHLPPADEVFFASFDF
jgi:hypothetical protein